MRLRLGRPDLDRYTDRFDVPPAEDASPVAITFVGVSTLLISSGTSAIMTDGFFSRPSLPRVAATRIGPDQRALTECLGRVGVTRLDAVLPVHSHYDHALDSAAVAARTGAQLVGGRSTANLGRGHGLGVGQVVEVLSGQTLRLGEFEVTFVESAHCPPDRFPGTIDAPLTPPARASAYRCGEAWSILASHAPTGRSMLVQGSAGFVPGALAGRSADVAYLGVDQLGVQAEGYLAAYWRETVRAVGARRVVLTHWDDFFRPLSQPLRALPYASDDLGVTMRVLSRLAADDGVSLHLPTRWRREDPWR